MIMMTLMSNRPNIFAIHKLVANCVHGSDKLQSYDTIPHKSETTGSFFVHV